MKVNLNLYNKKLRFKSNNPAGKRKDNNFLSMPDVVIAPAAFSFVKDRALLNAAYSAELLDAKVIEAISDDIGDEEAYLDAKAQKIVLTLKNSVALPEYDIPEKYVSSLIPLFKKAPDIAKTYVETQLDVEYMNIVFLKQELYELQSLENPTYEQTTKAKHLQDEIEQM